MAYNNIYNKKMIDTLGGALGLLESGKKSAIQTASKKQALANKRLKRDLYRHIGGLSGAGAQTLSSANRAGIETLGNIARNYDINKANQAQAINQFLSGQYNQNYNLGENRKLTREQMKQAANQFSEQFKFKKKQYEESKPKWYDYLLSAYNTALGAGSQVAKAFL